MIRNIKTIISLVIVFISVIYSILKYKNDSEKLTQSGIRFRKFFEKTGGIFTKFGQILSLRIDIFPIEICNELRKLLDEVPIFPDEVAKRIVQIEIGERFEEIFSDFREKPIASASLGQVYKAKLRTENKDVVIKILRPGIEKLISQDLKLIHFAAFVIDLIPLINIRVKPLANEFETWILEEIDYTKEASSIKRFSEYTTDLLPIFNIPVKTNTPKVFEEYSTSKILVMEFIKGLTVNKLIEIAKDKDSDEYRDVIKQGYDYKLIGKTIALMSAKHVFIDGFFNADPHPANIIANSNNDVYFIDMGLVGELEDRERMALFRFGRSLSFLDKETAFDAFKTIMDVNKVTDEAKLKKALFDMFEVMERFRDGSESKSYIENSSKAMLNLLKILNRMNVQVPPEIAKAFRAMVTADGIMSSLNPGISFEEVTQDMYRVTLAATYMQIKKQMKPKNINKVILKAISILEKEFLA